MPFFGTDGDTSAGIVPNSPVSAGEYSITDGYVYVQGSSSAVGVAGTPTHVSFWAKNSDAGASDIRVGVYKNSSSSLSGATLIGSASYTGTLTGTAGWVDIALSGTASFADTDYLWLAWLKPEAGEGTYFKFRPYQTDSSATARGDWTANSGGSYGSYFGANDQTSLPSTAPAVAGWNANQPVVAYITYTAGASGVVSKLALLGVG